MKTIKNVLIAIGALLSGVLYFINSRNKKALADKERELLEKERLLEQARFEAQKESESKTISVAVVSSNDDTVRGVLNSIGASRRGSEEVKLRGVELPDRGFRKR